MVKGAQKRMVVLRTADSALYEQAYFVLRDEKAVEERGSVAVREQAMLAEANRILSENLLPGRAAVHQEKKQRGARRERLWFFVGLLLGCAAATAFFLLFLR